MKKVQFNLTYYNENRSVVKTRDGRDVRIICTDAESVGDEEPTLIVGCLTINTSTTK